MINLELGENALDSEVFDTVFEMWWPRLAEKVEGEMNRFSKKTTLAGEEIRDERDILQEILSLTRRMAITREGSGGKNENMDPQALEDLVMSFYSIIDDIVNNKRGEMYDHLTLLSRPINYLLRKAEINGIESGSLRIKFDEAKLLLQELNYESKPISGKRVVFKKPLQSQNIETSVIKGLNKK